MSPFSKTKHVAKVTKIVRDNMPYTSFTRQRQPTKKQPVLIYESIEMSDKEFAAKLDGLDGYHLGFDIKRLTDDFYRRIAAYIKLMPRKDITFYDQSVQVTYRIEENGDTVKLVLETLLRVEDENIFDE